jgi:DNA-directed RNA polymerase subunit RPC12/RpoP
VSEADGTNITKLPVAFRDRMPDERTLVQMHEVPGAARCNHLFAQYLVDPAAAEVECQRCGEKLNPMWVLHQLATSDRRMSESQAAAKAMRERLEEKRRAKCQHCGRLTRVRLA